MKCFNADGGCTGFARDGGTHCNSCLANESGRAEFESAALRSARSLQMEHADVNLKRSEDAYRKERASTECAMVGCDVKISSDYTFCLDHKKTGMSYIDEMQKQIETIDALSQKVKSDGGSTSYYELPLSERMVSGILAQIDAIEQPTLQTGDVIELLVGNDFDAGNVIKALRRIFESKKGKGKEGVEQTYDIKKCHYFIDEVEKKL